MMEQETEMKYFDKITIPYHGRCIDKCSENGISKELNKLKILGEMVQKFHVDTLNTFVNAILFFFQK
jgi:hypothetical protein